MEHITWQQMLELFTEEIKETTHDSFWNTFQTLTNVDDLVKSIYNFKIFRKRMSAWLTKHPRCFSKEPPSDSDNIPEHPFRNFKSRIQFDENPEFPAASNSVMLQENKEQGRYTVAAKDINVGEALFVEEPFAMVLCDTEDTHCDLCCLPLGQVPARCGRCQVKYCSKTCLSEAEKQFHTHECGSVLAQHVGIARLALRVTLVAESLGCLSNDVQVDKYARVVSLLTHIDDMSPEDKLHYTLTAVLLVMDQVRARDLHGAEQRNALMKTLGGRVLHHLAQMVCNGNAITAYFINPSGSDGGMMQERQKRVATAIFPSASMMNHSCHPNILTSYVGHTLIARATRPINMGEEIFNCYGPHFTSMKTAQRREQLQQQYFFFCKCISCSLPQDFLDTSGIEALLCQACEGPVIEENRTCVACQKQLSLYELGELRDKQKLCADVMYEAEEKAAAGDLKEATACVMQGLDLQKQYLHADNRKIAQTHDFCGMLLARQGKYSKSLKHLRASLAIALKCHGELSVEVSGILDTMIDVAAEDLAQTRGDDWQERHKQALDWCTRAMRIVSTLLGPWHLRMQSLFVSHSRLRKLMLS